MNAKLPDISRLKDVKKRLKNLPSQESVTDTTNWENRSVIATSKNADSKKPLSRKLQFIRAGNYKIDKKNRTL